MQIKKYAGRTFTEVMQKVKKEFGKDAVIISTENLGGKVYVTAAKDYDIEERSFKLKKNIYSKPKPALAGKAYAAASKISQHIAADTPSETVPLGELSNNIEIESLKSQIIKQKKETKKQESFFLNELTMLRESLSSLLSNTLSKDQDYPLSYTPFIKAGIELGIDSEIVKSLLTKINIEDGFTEEQTAKQILKELLVSTMQTEDLFKKIDEDGGIFLFAGPTGVGKTTTVSKIATNLILKRDRDDIAVISLDFMRADAGGQLKRFSKILNIPFYHFSSEKEYISKIETLQKRYKIIMVDTAGVSPLCKSSLKFLEKVRKAQYTCPILHIPVSTEYEQALAIVDNYKKYLGDMKIVYTKEDEAMRNGLIGCVSVVRAMPVAFVTNGQNIPEDIVALKSSRELAEILFNKKY